jgi:uncharacterized protein
VNAEALEIHEHRKLAAHEAGHATAALLLGLEVESAHAPYWTIEDSLAGDPYEPAGQVRMTTASIGRDARSYALAILAGPICDDRADWPPSWPLSLAPTTTDERQVTELAKHLDLDRAGYSHLVQDAFALTASEPFMRLHAAIEHWLKTRGHADANILHRLKMIAEDKSMEHTTKAATATVTTDEGVFTAIAATYTVDRQNDIIVPGAFGKTIGRWQASGKNMPLHWNHEGDAASIIGYIDPHTMRETSDGLEVTGKLDLEDSATAKEAWRSMRNNAMSLSFGYIVTKSHPRSDGVNALDELDLFEVSIVPIPASPDTRVLAMKSLDNTADLAGDSMHDVINRVFAGVEETQRKAIAADALREKAMRIAREHAPVEIATFEC